MEFIKHNHDEYDPKLSNREAPEKQLAAINKTDEKERETYLRKEKLPYSRAALILGISSIFTAFCCFGITGVILGIIGLNNAKQAIALQEANPQQYTGISNANTGKTTSVIGIIFGILMSLLYAAVLTTEK